MARPLTLVGHSDTVVAVDFSADGRLIASGSWDNTVKVWDAHTRTCVRTMDRHSRKVCAVHFSPDSRLIASGSHDKTVKVWDTHTGACVHTLTGHSDFVEAVHFSPDGRFIASGSDDETVKVWDAHTGACVHTLTGHSDCVEAVRFSPNGRFIASGSDDERVKIWNAQTGAYVRSLIGHSDWVKVVHFSPDGRFIASGSDDETVKVWDANTGACVRTLTGHSGAVSAVHFSPDGRFIASGSDDETVRVWDAHTGACVRTITGHSNSVRSVRFSPDGRFIASGSVDKTVKVWDTSDLKCGPEGTSGDADEEKYCKDYWEVADSDGSQELDAQEALAFFSKARLPMSVLHRMWDAIATARGKRALTYDDFVLALRWVALAQNGEEASLARVQQGSLSLRAKIDVPGWNPFDRVARTLSETARHEEYWKVADADGSGEVDVHEAVAFLSKSGLRSRVLNEIWGFATSQGMFSSLDTERFKTALRLVAMAQKGMRLDVKEAAGGEMELIADFKINAAKPAPEPMPKPKPMPEPMPKPMPKPMPMPMPKPVPEPVPEPDTDLERMFAETALDDLTCEQLARVLEEVLEVNGASVRNVRERQVSGEALHDMREFQEFVQLSFPDKKKVEKWVAGRKSYEGFEEYLFGVLGGDSERAERACALLLESHAVSNLDEWLWFRKQPSKRANMRVIVRRFPELGTWPGGPEVEDWK